MAGMRVVVVATDADGNVDLADLKEKASAHADALGALMVTYPSTHGVFETAITEICDLVHEYGGQVYVDGANLNALVGLAAPGALRRRRVAPQPAQDVLHPARWRRTGHRSGRGARAPRAVPARPPARPRTRSVPAVAAAPVGSAGILPIPWAYIAMMGGDGLRRATQVAILAANYLAQRLGPHYPVLYTGPAGLVAHECILDLRADHRGDRRHRGGRRQAPHRLRLPRADAELPGRGHAHGRADRVGVARRARPVLRRR